MLDFLHLQFVRFHALTVFIIVYSLVLLYLTWRAYKRGKHKSDKSAPEWWMGSGSTWLDHGPYPSREAAIEEAKSFDWSCCWVGTRGTYEPFSRDLVEDLWEQEHCSVTDCCGPDSDDHWPPFYQPQDPEVIQANVKIRAILNQLFGPCNVWPIENIEFVDMKEAVVEV